MNISDVSVSNVRDMDWSELKYRFIPRTRDQQVLYVTLLFVLTIAVIVPIGAIIVFSFAENFPLTDVGYVFTVRHYTDFVGNVGLLLEIIKNTFIYAAGATTLAMIVGTLAALYVVKYLGDSRLELFMLLPYGIPSVAALTGWVLLLGNAGLITEAVMNFFNMSSQPWNLYSLAGMIWVEGVHTAPVAFLLLLPALSNVPEAMDDASSITGAGRLKTFRKIVLPLVWPSLLSTFIFLFVRTMATVATPSVLGVPNRIFTFGSAIPYLFLSGDVNYSKAMSFSVLMTIISGFFILYYLKVQSQEGKFTTVSGAGSIEPKIYDTTRFRKYAGISVFVGYLFIAGVLPFLTIIWYSLLPSSTLHLIWDPTMFTLDNYVALFTGNARGVVNWWRALRNTLLVGISVPTIAMTVALLIAYANQTIKMPLGGTLSFLAAVPLAVPGIARGLGFLVAFIMTPIYGTFWMLFIAFHGMAIPIAMRYASPALTRIGDSNTEASIISGANTLRSFRKITMPLVSRDFIAGWMHMFVSIVRNVTIPVLLYSFGSEMIAVELLNVLRAGYAKTAATLAVVIALISLVPYLVLQYWRVRSGGTRGAR